MTKDRVVLTLANGGRVSFPRNSFVFSENPDYGKGEMEWNKGKSVAHSSHVGQCFYIAESFDEIDLLVSDHNDSA